MIYNTDSCKCSCHTALGVKHVIACCSKCPKCDKRIIRSKVRKHGEVCGKLPATSLLKKIWT